MGCVVKVHLDDIFCEPGQGSLMDYDIFFRYPHKDITEAQNILQDLQVEGMKGWVDQGEIPDYTGITKSIMEGLAYSKVAYYYLSQWEMNYRIRDKVYPDALSDNHEGRKICIKTS